MPNSSVGIEDWELVSGETGSTNGQRIAEDKDCVTGISASILIPGKGKPLHDQAILSDRSTRKIVYVGPLSSIPSKYQDVSLHEIPVLMPGMWECHSHFMGASPNKPIDLENLAMTNPAEAGARNVRALKDTLYAGFTSCVDLGGYGPELQKVIDEGLILGPTIYGAGAAIGMTAGHGDVFEYESSTFRRHWSSQLTQELQNSIWKRTPEN